MTLVLALGPDGGAPRPGRIVSPRPGALRPLFAPTRLVRASALEAEEQSRQAATALAAARADAARALHGARWMAARIVDEAKASADAVRAEAYRCGQREGAERLARVWEAIGDEVGQLRRIYAEDVRRTAFELARRIVKVEFRADPMLVVALMEDAVAKVRDDPGVKIHVHPDDFAFVNAAADEIKDRFAMCQAPRIIADDGVPRHGARIHRTANAFREVGLDERLCSLEKAIEAVDRGAGPGGGARPERRPS